MSRNSIEQHGGRDCADDVHAAVALFAALVALGIACLGFLCRFGFADNSPLQWAKFVGLSWFLLFFSSVARMVLRTKNEPGPWRSWTSHASLTLAALALAALLGVEWGTAGGGGAGGGARSAAFVRGSEIVLFGLGGAGFLLGCWSVVRAARLRDLAALIAFAAIFSVYGAGASCGSGYQNPLFVEAMCFNFCQMDELYHASICNMLRTYGVPSTGFDGVPFLPYHFGSHWLFAQLCNLLDVRVIDFYSRGYRVVFVPFGVLSLGTFAASLMQGRRRDAGPLESPATGVENRGGNDVESVGGALAAANRSRPVGPLFWLIVWTGYVSFMPYPPFLTPIYAWSEIIVSESYALGVAVSLLGLAWAWSFFQGLRDRQNRWSGEVVASAVFLAGLMAVIGVMKISQMAILAAVAVFFFVRLKWYRSPVFNVLLAAVAAGVCCVLWLTLDTTFPKATNVYMPFGFVRNCVEPQLWPYFWLFYYAWLWIVAAVRLREEGIRTLSDLANALRGRRLLDLEFLFVAAVAGAVPAMFLITYSSAHFFSEYQQWLALGILLSIVVCRPAPRHDAPGASGAAGRFGLSALGGVTVSRVFLGAIVLTVGGMALSNTLRLAAGIVHDNAVSRGHAGGGTGVNAALSHGRFREATGILKQTAEEVERRLASDKNVLTLFGSLDAMPLSEKRASLLFIPRSNRQFWDLLHGSRWPLDGPLVAPALSGVAMIDGLSALEKGGEQLYGYPKYPPPDPSRRQPPLDEYLPVLRSRCARMGYKQLIVIDNGPDGLSRERRYDCR
jgi:hypothetical protein